jgi:hypothetical protein
VSRKNLSRTVIEGGRRYYNHYKRDHSHRIERATTRAWLDLVATDVDEADFTTPPKRPSVPKQFHDKLSAATRWLDSHVGRPWNSVYSELCAKFDRRSLAGMHVVDAHMVGEVWRGDLSSRRWADLFVDRHGILRRSPFANRAWRKLRAELHAWTRGRRAANTYMGWWWFRLVGVGPCCDGRCGGRNHFLVGESYFHRTSYVGDAPLTKGDRRRLDRLHDLLWSEVVMRWP